MWPWSYLLLIIEICALLPAQTSLLKIQRLQNRALRICFKSDGYDRVNDLHVRARIATVDKRHEFDILQLFHKKVYLNKRQYCDITISDTYNGNDSVLNPPLTRAMAAPQINTKIPNSEMFRESLSYTGASLWNSLSSELRNTQDYNVFKSSVKWQIYIFTLSTTPWSW